MPQITVKGAKPEELKKISTTVIEDLAKIIGCPEDWLILELNHSQFFGKGTELSVPPVIAEVSWWKRPDEVKDQVARYLGEALTGLGYPLVQVIFTTLTEDGFYEFEG